MYDQTFQKSNSLDALKFDANYMLYCTGIINTNKQSEILLNLFNDQLATIYSNLIKNDECSWSMSALAVTEDSIYDILGNLRAI